MNIGIIGTGNMGTVLIDAFIESNAVPPSQITITNRTLRKAEDIQLRYPEIKIADSGEEVVKSSQLIFICVKPLEIYPLIQKLSPYLTTNKCIVSITSPISVEQIESIVHCQVARVIPSITNRALSGVSLITFGKSCSTNMKEHIQNLFSQISTPIQIDQNITRIASDIVSCGPAFFSYLLQKFVEAATNETEISKEQATILSSEMIIGMGKLLEKEIFTLPTLQEKVCVKGGITGEGIRALEENIGELFEHMIRSTHKKYHEDIYEINQQFNETST